MKENNEEAFPFDPIELNNLIEAIFDEDQTTELAQPINEVKEEKIQIDKKIVKAEKKELKHFSIEAMIPKVRKFKTAEDLTSEITEQLIITVNNIYDNFKQIPILDSWESDFHDAIKGHVKWEDALLPRSLNLEGSKLMATSVFWILYVHMKLDNAEDTNEKNAIFLTLIDTAITYELDDRNLLFEFFISYVSIHFTIREIAAKLKKSSKYGSKPGVEKMEIIPNSEFRFMLRNPECFNSSYDTNSIYVSGRKSKKKDGKDTPMSVKSKIFPSNSKPKLISSEVKYIQNTYKPDVKSLYREIVKLTLDEIKPVANAQLEILPVPQQEAKNEIVKEIDEFISMKKRLGFINNFDKREVGAKEVSSEEEEEIKSIEKELSANKKKSRSNSNKNKTKNGKKK